MADLVWLHEDALRRTHPVFTAAAGNARVIYVWDNSYLDATLIGQKRRMFIYETLAELDLDILAGTADRVIARLVAEAGVSKLFVPATPNPAFHALLSLVRSSCPDLEITVIEDSAFVALVEQPDLGRFFRYWNKAKKHTMRHGGVTG